VQRDYRRVRRGLGEDRADGVIDAVKVQEAMEKQRPRIDRDYVR